jgi:hypothetical protein
MGGAMSGKYKIIVDNFDFLLEGIHQLIESYCLITRSTHILGGL